MQNKRQNAAFFDKANNKRKETRTRESWGLRGLGRNTVAKNNQFACAPNPPLSPAARYPPSRRAPWASPWRRRPAPLRARPALSKRNSPPFDQRRRKPAAVRTRVGQQVRMLRGKDTHGTRHTGPELGTLGMRGSMPVGFRVGYNNGDSVRCGDMYLNRIVLIVISRNYLVYSLVERATLG